MTLPMQSIECYLGNVQPAEGFFILIFGKIIFCS